MLKFVPNHLRLMCENAVKKLLLVIMYVPDRYNNQEICNKAIIGIDGMLKFVLDRYKNQKCVITLLIIMLMHYNLFPISIRLKK